ncbi:MAG: hypothetical protein H6742_14815 [Alphaproteobacteria bacterium]|nr:hypothetical protein [Alphaproteobacteria bacterium]
MTRRFPTFLLLLLATACGDKDPPADSGDGGTDTTSDTDTTDGGTDTTAETDTDGGGDSGATTVTGCDHDPWLITTGNADVDEAWGVGLASDGDVIFASHEAAPVLTDVFVRRYGPDGTERWARQWGEAFSEQAFIVQEQAGTVYVAGAQFHSWDLLDTHAWLQRFEGATGAPVGDPYTWKSPGWDEIDGLQVDDGGVLLSGWTENDDPDVRVAALGADLTERWHSDLDLGGVDGANGHLAVIGDVLYAAGHAQLGVGTDAFLAAFDTSDGHALWTKRVDDGGVHTEALGLTTDGRRLFGVGEGRVDGDGQLWVWAWDADGDALWSTAWGGAGPDLARAIRVDPIDGSLVVVANAESGGAGGVDLVFLRLDADDGTVLEEQWWGGTGDDIAHDFVLDGDRIYVAGETTSWGAGSSDAFALAGCQRPWRLPTAE